MKRSILLSMAAGLLCTWNANAQFLTATIPEFYNPGIANIALDAGNTNCHSYGSLQFNSGDYYDVYVHTFDGQTGSIPPYTYNWGVAWTLRNLTTPGTVNGYAANPIPLLDVTNMDVAIIQQNSGVVQFAVVYYRPSMGYYVAFLNVNAVANTVALAAAPTLLMSSAGATNASGIHIDVNEAKNFVITFGMNFRVYACAGIVSGGTIPTLGAVNDIIANGPSLMPDVALCNSVNAGLNAHFVYYNYSTTNIEESVVDFNTIYTATGPIAITTEYVSSGLLGYTAPRIDCPDHSTEDVWSYVIMGENVPAPIHQVMAVIKDPSVGGIYETSINDGSFPPNAMNITPDKNYFPVVAYDADPNMVHFSWVLSGNILTPFYGINTGYVGVTVRNGALRNNLYWMMETIPMLNTKILRKVALSGQNDQSPDMYATMTHTNAAAGGDYINCKMVPWGNIGFKPTGINTPGITSVEANISPNPSAEGFRLNITNAQAGQQFTVQLTDISGRNIHTGSGNLATVKDALYKASLDVQPGIYFVNLAAEGMKGKRSFKVVKQ
jgi:hypothetical protein